MFDEDAALQNLKRREAANGAVNEQLRQELLRKAIQVLEHQLKDTDIEVWLIGSILHPNRFTKRSDIDIVIKNYLGDRFELWTNLENEIDREIELIRFEECDFQDEIKANGLKVL